MRIPILGVIVVAALGFAGAADAQSNPPQVQPQPADTDYVTYDDGPISLPLGIGLRVPEYSRVDGLVIHWGPKISLAGGRIDIDPIVTYRSHIGAVDGRARAKLQLTQFDEIVIAVGRETFTNDAWIRSDLINSLGTLFAGNDARNYFRADRVTAAFTHEFVAGSATWKPTIGVLHENAWSTGISRPHSSAPWSVVGSTDDDKMRRPNPAIVEGHTTSGLGGLGFVYDEMDVKVSATAGVEYAFDSPPIEICFIEVCTPEPEDGNFTQFTIHSRATFPTFSNHHFDFRGHAVFGSSDDVPPQRYAYLGGTGTLPTVDLLALGGDRLFFVEGEYIVPLRRPVLPFIGTPVVSLHYAAGAAGVGELPDFIQNIGVGLGVRLVKVEYHIDPNFKDTDFRRKGAFSFGFSLSL